MKHILLLINLLISIKAYTQPDIKHSIYFKDKKCIYDGDPQPSSELTNYYWNIESHSNGSFYAIRPLPLGSPNTQYDVTLYRLNAQFDTIWSKQLGGSEDDWIYSIKEIDGGNMILSGTTSSNDGDVPYGHTYSVQEIWVVKIDTNGNIIQGMTFGGSAGGYFRSAIYSSDGYLYLSGETNADDYDFAHVNNGPFDTDVWIAKLDTNLNLKWVRLFSGDSDEGGFSIEEVTPNMLVLCIITAGTNSEMLGNQSKGITDMLVYCIDSNKNTRWARRLGSSGYNDARKCLVDPIRKNIYVVGECEYDDLDVDYQTSDSVGNTWIVKLDTLGNLLESKAYGNKQAGYFGAPMNFIDAIWHNEHLWVSAFSIGGGGDMDPRIGSTENNNTWIGMIDTQANLVGKYTIGTNGNDTPVDLFSNGSELYLHGWSAAPNNTMSCIGKNISTYIVNLGVAPVGVEEHQKSNVFSVYPNPNTGQLNLKLNGIPHGEMIKYKIVNTEGKTCQVGEFISSEKDQLINTPNLITGSYTILLHYKNNLYSTHFSKL